MKMIYMWVDGVKLFESNEFEVDFTLQKLVRRTSVPLEVNEVYPDLFLPNTMAFVGMNGSGKSITLRMVDLINNLIFNGNVFAYSDIYNDTLEVEAIYLIGEEIVCFKIDLAFKNNQSIITKYQIYKKKYLKTYYVNDYLYEFADDDLFLSCDKQAKKIDLSAFENDVCYYAMSYEVNMMQLMKYQAYLKNIIKIIDDNVQNLVVEEDKLVITYKNGMSVEGDYNTLENVLSTGTMFALKVFAKAILCLQNGSLLIVDDLSSYINRLVVEELIKLFQDESVNKKFATLVFATNYIEVIDSISRTDCVYLVKKVRGTSIFNLSELVARNEKVKSKYIFKDSKITVRMKREMKKSMIDIMEEVEYETL